MLPAEFEVADLAIDPPRAMAGEAGEVSIVLRNTGGLEGSYVLDLAIDGRSEQSRQITLAGGESTRAVFTVVRNEPGTYLINMNGLTATLTVAAPEAPTFRSGTLLLAVSLAAPAAGLLVYLFKINFRI